MSEQLLTWPMKCYLDMYSGYIYNDFILGLFVTWCFTLFDFCLCNFKLGVGSREFLWEDWRALHARKDFLYMLKIQVW